VADKTFVSGSFEAALNAAGKTPLPPYISRGNRYCPRSRTGSAIRQSMLRMRALLLPNCRPAFYAGADRRVRKAGAEVIFITLHVGLGTFQPIREETIEDHRMHEEFYHLASDTAVRINQTRRAGGRIICIVPQQPAP